MSEQGAGAVSEQGAGAVSEQGAGAVDADVWHKTARTPRERDREVEALRLLGPAVVELLAVRGDVLVLEHVRPGATADDVEDATATGVLAATLPRLWVPVPPGCTLPTLERECAALDDAAAVDALPQQLVVAARAARDRLLATAEEPVVLHGDLHHGNLLRCARRGWVAIDPHGVVGERGYDVGPWLINPRHRDPVSRLGARLGLLERELGVARERLAAWGLVRAVLSEAWHVQDHGRPEGTALQVAGALVRGR